MFTMDQIKNKQAIKYDYKLVTYNMYYLCLKGKLRKKCTKYVTEPRKSCIFLCFRISLYRFLWWRWFLKWHLLWRERNRTMTTGARHAAAHLCPSPWEWRQEGRCELEARLGYTVSSRPARDWNCLKTTVALEWALEVHKPEKMPSIFNF